MWAWTTLNIDEDIMHPVERLSRRLAGAEIAEAKGKFLATTDACTLFAYLFVAAVLLTRETLSRIEDATAVCFSRCLTASQMHRTLSSVPGYL